MRIDVTVMLEHLYWRCDGCGYKQLKTMTCYCAEFEKMRREWAANQNIATLDILTKGTP